MTSDRNKDCSMTIKLKTRCGKTIVNNCKPMGESQKHNYKNAMTGSTTKHDGQFVVVDSVEFDDEA